MDCTEQCCRKETGKGTGGIQSPLKAIARVIGEFPESQNADRRGRYVSGISDGPALTPRDEENMLPS